MVKESELVEGLRERAKLIVEHELRFPWRQTYARYRHVAEAVAEDEAQAAWDGLGGRLKALRREVAAGQAKAEAGQADIEEMKADVSEVKADVSEVKALLEKLVAQSLQNAA
jgi:chromosome segregation ATPase